MDPFTTLTPAEFDFIAAFEAERTARADWHSTASTLRVAEASLAPGQAALITRLLTLPALEVVAA